MKYKPIKPLKKQELARGTFLCQTFFALIELKSLTKKYGAIKNQKVVLLLYWKPSKKKSITSKWFISVDHDQRKLEFEIFHSFVFICDHRYDL